MATENATGHQRGVNDAEIERVLVVEDEIVLALDIADLLEDEGFVVVGPCIRLVDAKDVARTEKFDAALLDVNLGSGDTSAPVAELLRQREIPVAFVTACDPSEIEDLHETDTVIEKPISRKALLEALADW